MREKIQLIEDWVDVVLIAGLDFLLIVLGVWTLPQLPEHTHFYFSLAILCSAIYFTRKVLYFILNKIGVKKNVREL